MTEHRTPYRTPHLIRQAIETRWHEPTHTLCSRVSARASAGKVVLHWDYSLNVDENHMRAAVVYASKFGWLDTSKPDWQRLVRGGGLAKGGFVWLIESGPIEQH